ncbi:unnamed protein product, partial [Effrenium voratum]
KCERLQNVQPARMAAAACLSGQFRGVCSPHELWFLLHRVLGAFGQTDLLVVVPQEDCEKAARLLPNATELSCVPDRPFSSAEKRWLDEGPGLCWDRERYLLQLRLVHRCGELLRKRLQAGAQYRWLLRLRADVLWHRFPSEQLLAAEGAGMLLLPWTPILQWQAFADNFAVGPPELMLIYFEQYSYVLDPRNWGHYDFQHGDKVWRRYWAHECNYPELILERYLGEKRVPVRYTRSICFVRLRVCGQLPVEDHCKPAAAGGFPDDLRRWRHLHLAGLEVLPEQTFPPHYEHDAVLAAKLVDFFHAEQRRTGRPQKILDLGCGRGTLVGEFRQWRLLAVGLDANPLLTATLGEYGMVEDITQNLSFTIRSAHPRCVFRPHPGKFAAGFEYEHAGKSAGFEFDGDPSKQDMTNPVGWLNWINYVASRCCAQLSCRGFDTNGLLRWQLPERQTWSSTSQVWLYEKYQILPHPDEAQVSSPFQHGPGTIVPVSEGAATMDWVISLDVGQHIPRARQAGFLQNLARLGQGIILSWGEAWADRRQWRQLLALGFWRDRALEEELRLFAGIGLRSHLRRSLLVLRKTAMLRSCALEPVEPSDYCEPGLTFGCLDATHIWVRGHCNGLFRRSAGGSSAVGPCRVVTSSLHEYEECELAAPGAENLQPGPAYVANFDCFSQDVPVEDFWRLHGGSISALFDSADPLVRQKESVWSRAPCGLLALGFKLARLVSAPQSSFVSEVEKPWPSEVRFLLTSWRWPWICWLAGLLRRAERRLLWRPKRLSLFGSLAAELHRCGWPSRARRCQAALGKAPLLGKAFPKLRAKPLAETLQDGRSLWKVLSRQRSGKGKSCAVMRPEFERYLQRLVALPY